MTAVLYPAIEEVADAIEAEPGRYDQEDWASFQVDGNRRRRITTPTDQPPDCGTAYCIGGWRLILSGWTTRPVPLGYLDGRMEWGVEFTTPAGRATSRYIGDIAAHLLGYPSRGTIDRIFDIDWHPRPGLTVPQALRILARGGTYTEITYRHNQDEEQCPKLLARYGLGPG